MRQGNHNPYVVGSNPTGAIGTTMRNPERLTCKVLAADFYTVLRHAYPCKDALTVVLEGKAYVLENYPDAVFRSMKLEIPAPQVIVIKRPVKLPPRFYRPPSPSLRNLKRRDKNTCQYCGKTELASGEKWTRDHIFPRSRGGEHIWENLVLSCSTCNNRKGDLTPSEAKMTLLTKPWVPTKWQIEHS